MQRLKEQKSSPAFEEFLSHYRQLNGCPVTATLQVVGGKWKPVILYLIDHEVNRFGELLRLIAGISKKVLTQQLRELEADQLIERQVFDQLPARVEYRLSAAGASLRPILQGMCQWGLKQSPAHSSRPLC